MANDYPFAGVAGLGIGYGMDGARFALGYRHRGRLTIRLATDDVRAALRQRDADIGADNLAPAMTAMTPPPTLRDAFPTSSPRFGYSPSRIALGMDDSLRFKARSIIAGADVSPSEFASFPLLTADGAAHRAIRIAAARLARDGNVRNLSAFQLDGEDWRGELNADAEAMLALLAILASRGCPTFTTSPSYGSATFAAVEWHCHDCRLTPDADDIESIADPNPMDAAPPRWTGYLR